MELTNAAQSFYGNDQECEVGRGDLNKEEKVKFQYHRFGTRKQTRDSMEGIQRK